MKRLSRLLMLAMLVALLGLGLTGCGDDGDDGSSGMSAYEIAVANGFTGTEEEWLDSLASEDAEMEESCNVCHGADATYDIAVKHETNYEIMENDDLVATVTGITDDGTGILTIDFAVEDQDGNAVTGLPTGRVYMADMVPAGAAGWDSVYPERWASESGNDANWTDNGDGTYSYVMDTAADPADPDFDATAVDFDVTHTQRVAIRLSGDFYNNGIAIQDFNLTGAGAQTLVDPVAVKAPTDGCTNCHSDQMLGAAHSGGYLDTRACVICHSPIGHYADRMTEDDAYLPRFIHGIHAAKSSDELAGFAEFEEGGGHARFPDAEGVNQGYAAVTYPLQIKDCAVCHTGNGNMTDDYLTNPTKEICTSCHTVAADAHPNDMADNALCTGCHSAGSNVVAGTEIGITAVHEVTTLKHDPAHEDNEVSLTPNYTADITLSADANADGVYEAGEEILVTVTTSNYAAGEYAVAGGTSRANLYVYGPRANAMPVLTPGSTTDPDFDPATDTPSQSHSLLVDAAADDAQVMTDASGFKYQLFPIPDDLAAGTYMAMAYVTTDTADCSGIYRGSVCIDGWAMTTFQVGTATEEAKVAGECTSCHDQSDWGTYYHRSYFGTDGCIACHDESGNHADPIANRVHAVHGATEMGDLLGADWSEITFPQSDVAEGEPTTSYCMGCHNSGNESYLAASNESQPSTWGEACIGCHGDVPGAQGHMEQNGAEFSHE